LRWLGQHGASFPHLQLKYYTVDYRGVHAKARIAADQTILVVPHELIMTTDKAKETKIGRAIAASRGEVRTSHSWLAAMLLQEKYDPNSFWKPYIDTLPVHYRNMPLFFDEEELKELQGSFTLEMISNRKISLRMEYDAIAKFCPEFAAYHHLEFVWARLAVITRIFGFEIGTYKTDGLVPMADMLNHKRPHETMWTFDNGLNGFTITSTKRLLKGAQIFDSYGRKCNSRYFVNYGFSLDENEDNQVAMNFSFLANDPLAATKQRLLGGKTRRWQIPFDHRERVASRCLSWLRVVHANEEEMKTVLACEDIKQLGALSPRNEAQVCQHLAIEAKRTLAGFPTTLDEDNKLLQAGGLTMNIRNCVVMRRGEKQVLHAYINLGSMVDGWLDFKTLKRDFVSKIKNLGREPSFEWRLENYVKDVWYPLHTGVKVEWQETSNAHED
jgi:histone-lysine N-methyltransferase SETD3